MRVKNFCACDWKELEDELNAELEKNGDENIEIQYQHCASYTNYGGDDFFSAMVIFK